MSVVSGAVAANNSSIVSGRVDHRFKSKLSNLLCTLCYLWHYPVEFALVCNCCLKEQQKC